MGCPSQILNIQADKGMEITEMDQIQAKGNTASAGLVLV